jgi:hypothetical protein
MKNKKHEPLNIIIMRKTGRMYSVDVSPKMLAVGGVFFLIFMVLSVAVINRFTDLYLENKKLQQRVERLTQTVDDYQYQSQVLTQYQKLVGELNKVDQKKDTVDSEATKKGVAAGDGVSAAPKEEPTGPKASADGSTVETAADTMAAIVPAPSQPPIDVEKLSMVPDEGTDKVSFQFVLNNIDPKNKTISGYLFIVLTNNSTNPPRLAAHPEVELKDGLPVDYKKGTLFSIRHGKTVKGQIEHLDKALDYQHAWILAFSEGGELLMKKHLSSENV